MATPQAQTIRRWVLTGSFAAVTATGALYGAGLKTRQEFKEERAKRLEATPAQQIEQLEITRADLVRKRTGLEKKIEELAARKAGAGQGQGPTSPGTGGLGGVR